MSSARPVDGLNKVLEVMSGRMAHGGAVATEGFVPEGVCKTKDRVGRVVGRALLLDF